MCKVLHVSRAGFYKYLRTKSNPKHKPAREKQLEEYITLVFHEHKKNYGYRKVHAQLKATYNLQISEKIVRRIMKKLGLRSQARKPKKSGTKVSKVTAAGHIYDNLLKRDFSTTRINEKWVTDVTEIPAGGEKLFVSAIMDLHNNRIVGYKDSVVQDVQLVEDTLLRALTQTNVNENLILHSDRGMPYRSNRWKELMDSYAIQPSMSRKANAIDNACIESFFSFLKTERREELKAAKDVEEAKQIVRSYIDYYNHNRIQGVLDYHAPINYVKAS